MHGHRHEQKVVHHHPSKVMHDRQQIKGKKAHSWADLKGEGEGGGGWGVEHVQTMGKGMKDTVGRTRERGWRAPIIMYKSRVGRGTVGRT